MAMSRRSTSSSRPSTRDRDRDRIGSCTHLNMTRLWDETGHEKCSLCYRRPIFGWLYRCTQDHNGFLPASDFHMIDNTRRLEHDADLYTLSPSVSEAASRGHYTDAELEVLWKQKIEVRKIVRQIRPTTSSSISTASSSNYSIAATATYSTLPSTESDTDPEFEPEIPHYLECLQSCRGPLEPIQEVSIDLEKDHRILPFAKTALPSLCNFRVCHDCRPNYRERAWLSLNRVLKTHYRQLAPPRHEVQNKRVSDVNVVKKLGASASSLLPDYALQHIFRAPIKRNSRTEFQDTVQRLLKDQDPDIVRYTTNDPVGDGGREELPRQISYQNLAQMASISTMDETDTSFAPSTAGSASFNNGDTTFSSVYDALVVTDDSEFTPSFLGPRPLYHRRGSERITSIRIPPRSAISHCGESISSMGLSTHHSTSSCPGMMERRSIEQEKKGISNEDQENMNDPLQSRLAPKIVVVDSDMPPQNRSGLTDLTHINLPGFKEALSLRSRPLVR